VASSGIAAQLLQGGRTAHSRLKIPFDLQANSTCNIRLGSTEAELLQKAKIILWDECPMCHRHAFEALDRTLRDIMAQIDPRNKHIPFGNKIMVFGGDFRQILPVIKKGNKYTIINASFNRSKLWKEVKILKLIQNMRILSMSGDEATEAQEFADYLIRIGEGTEPTITDENGVEDLIQLPDSITKKMNQTELIKITFPDIFKEK
jgi:ATP-dependent DNA helicase PIF1